MKIIKCSKCKKYIHKTNTCFYCGNTMEFEEVEMPSIHENAVVEYSTVESLIESKRFTEALTLAHTVIEWIPNRAGIFWLRLLAKNKCSNIVQLIQKGFNCARDADFCNALAFSTEIENSALQDVKNIILAIQKALKAEILNHKYHCKIKTNILQTQKNMKDELEIRKKNLFVLWAELEETEHSLYALEKECILYSKEHIDALDNAARSAYSIKAETYQLEECTAENFYKYQVKIDNILQQSKQAKDALERMKKQHPLIKSFNDLLKKRDEQVRKITNEISSLQTYQATIQCMLDEIDKIEHRHIAAIRAVENFDFVEAANLLGKDIYNNVLQSIGLNIDIQIYVSSQEWLPNIKYASHTDSDVADIDDDMDDIDDIDDTDNYYSAWLPNNSY